jgi:hypothetical protein
MLEEVLAFGRREAWQELTDAAPQGFVGALFAYPNL